jgi:hypothetical protein
MSITFSEYKPCGVGEWYIYIEENYSEKDSESDCAHKLVFSKKIAW